MKLKKPILWTLAELVFKIVSLTGGAAEKGLKRERAWQGAAQDPDAAAYLRMMRDSQGDDSSRSL